MHRRLVTGVLLVSVAARGRCQTAGGVADGSLDIGGALLRQSGLAETNVLTAAAQFRLVTPVFSLGMNGIAARTPADLYTGQGVLSASRYAPPTQRLRWELGATTSAFGLSNVGPSFGWQFLAREHLVSSLGGLFVGAAGGAVVQHGIPRRVVNAQTGGYLRFDPLGRDELSTALAYTDAGVLPDSNARLRYSDAIGYWTHHVGPLELVAGGGVRVFSSRFNTQTWGSASAVLWVTQGFAIVLATGRALEDVARGVPSARYLSAAVRFGASSGPPAITAHVGLERRDADGGAIEVNAGGDSVRIVKVRLRSATTVELMADFTDWEPVNMSQLPNGEWTLERVIAPGTHRVAIRIDGGSWGAPPNLPHVSDEFGGEVGLLIVP